MEELSAEFWSNRYKTNETGWDVGEISTPLKNYFDQLINKNISILIPGAGNAYEAEYLHQQGFTNVTVLDYAKEPLNNFSQRVTAFPKDKLIHQDFFLHEGSYDLIIEQTFFCALHPSLREKYVEKMHELLHTKGKLVGLLFNDNLNNDKPPFGGNKSVYSALFQERFAICVMEQATNSIQPRASRELFVIFKPKN